MVITRGETSYEKKLEKVLQDLKARQSTRNVEDWDVTEKICKQGRDIISKMVKNGEMTEQQAKYLKPSVTHLH